MATATICIFGVSCEMSKGAALEELWSRGLREDHIVNGITFNEFFAYCVKRDAQVEAEGQEPSGVEVECSKCHNTVELTNDELVAADFSVVWTCPECIV